MVEFAKHSNTDEAGSSKSKGKKLASTVSFYDDVYKVITDELKRFGRSYTQTPSITTIDGSWGTAKHSFSEDQYEFFSELYREELIKAGKKFDKKSSGKKLLKQFSKLKI